MIVYLGLQGLELVFGAKTNIYLFDGGAWPDLQCRRVIGRVSKIILKVGKDSKVLFRGV